MEQTRPYSTYALPDVAVCEALLYYAPPEVNKIIDAIRIGHHRLKPGNKVDEFASIDINLPLRFRGQTLFDGKLLNDPVFQFCKAIKKFPEGTWKIPSENDRCFAVSATANSDSNPAPFTAFQVLETQCTSWTNVGIGVGAGYKDPSKLVTGAGHNPLKHNGVLFDPWAQRNRNQPNSWITQGRSIFDQMSLLLNVHSDGGKMKNQYTKGYLYGCVSHNFSESDATSQQTSQQNSHKEHENTPISWGNHEAWSQMLQVSEMAVILHSISEGGSVFLKIRIFHDAKTQYVCALFASFFESFDIVAVASNRESHVLVHYNKKKRISEDDLTIITTFLLDHCVDSTMEVFHPPLKCYEPTTLALNKVDIAACEMQKYKDENFHILACAVRALKNNKNIPNAFTSISARISDIRTQISLTGQLRGAMYPKNQLKGIPSELSAWRSLITDIG